MKKIYALTTVGLMIATAIFSMIPVTATEPIPDHHTPVPMIRNVNNPWNGYPQIPPDTNIYFEAEVRYMDPPCYWTWTFNLIDGTGQHGAPVQIIKTYSSEYSSWCNFYMGFNYIGNYTVNIDVTNNTEKHARWPMVIPYKTNYTDIYLPVDANGPYSGITNFYYHGEEFDENGIPVHFRGEGNHPDYESLDQEIIWTFGDQTSNEGYGWDVDYQYSNEILDPWGDYFVATLTWTFKWGEREEDVWIDSDTADVLIYCNRFLLYVSIEELFQRHYLPRDPFIPAIFVVKVTTASGDFPDLVYTPEVFLDVIIWKTNPLIQRETIKRQNFPRLCPGYDSGWIMCSYVCQETGTFDAIATCYFLEARGDEMTSDTWWFEVIE